MLCCIGRKGSVITGDDASSRSNLDMSRSTLRDSSKHFKEEENIKTERSSSDTSEEDSEGSSDDAVQSILVVKTHEESIRNQGLGSDDSTLSSRMLSRLNSESAHLSENPKVTHSTVSVRTFPQIPGDNPAVSFGVPLSLDWKHIDEDHFEIDQYEEAKPPKREDLKIPSNERTQILVKNGHKMKVIKKAMINARMLA